MSDLGDLLAALHDAPRVPTYFGTASLQWEAVLRDPWESNDEGRLVRVLDSDAGEGPAPKPVAFWVDGASTRADVGDERTILRGEEGFRYFPGSGGHRWHITESPRGQLLPPPAALRASSLLGACTFSGVHTGEHAGRRCWSANARVRDDPAGVQLRFTLGTPSFDVRVDEETGIVLYVAGQGVGQHAVSFEVLALQVGAPIDPAVFTFETPDGSAVRTEGEVRLDRARNAGIDVSGIDPEDPAAVARAMERLNPRPFDGRAAELTRIVDQLERRGPPPADEHDARIDIGRAVQCMGDLDDDETELPYVEDGWRLVGVAHATDERYGTYANRTRSVVERIEFLDADEAAAWWTVELDGLLSIPQAGRVRRIDGVWKITYETFTSLRRAVGIDVPTRPPSPPDEA